MREELAGMDAEGYRQRARSEELRYFGATHRYCGKCGAETEGDPMTGMLTCPQCGTEIFPRLNPAIVVLVLRGDKALLVHARNFREGMHALVAGFVEAGETPEQCVAREIREETTLTVRDIRYVGSQSWPFPSQLMMAFTARYESGELNFADGELTQGGWFDRDALPPLPTPPSLSRAVIDRWIAGEFS